MIYGFWKMIKREGRYGICKCVCGKIKKIRFQTLEDRSSKSCGCKRYENGNGIPGPKPKYYKRGKFYSDDLVFVKVKKNVKINKYAFSITSRGGLSHHRLYTIWRGMKNRCEKHSHTSYKYYGGRGIKIYKRWLEFLNFYNDMIKTYNYHYKKYGKINTTLDRIDNNGDYCKENCKWATKKQQGFNSKLALEKRTKNRKK